MNGNLVEVNNLHVLFHGARTVHALNGVDVSVGHGEVLGLLGESGSGKSVLLRSLMRLNPARRTHVSGTVIVDGRDVMALGQDELRAFRGSVAAMVFQEPLLAFDPVYTVGNQIAEAIRVHEAVSRDEAARRAVQLLDLVQIPQARRRFDAYPHEISGGMRQRAMIALALSCRPKLLLADEPTTALDATVQIQVLLLLRQLQRELGMSIVFVTHDIGVAVEVSDRLAVMYAGRIVERGDLARIVAGPAHPYTAGLMASTVHGVCRERRLDTIPGAPPDLRALPRGCAFAPRCARAEEDCLLTAPELVAAGNGLAACLHPLESGRTTAEEVSA